MAVETNPKPPIVVNALERYPVVPKPITVDVRFVCDTIDIPVIDETLSCCVDKLIDVIEFAVIVIVLKLVPIVSPVSVNPVPVPIKRAFTVSELMKAVVPVKLKVERDETLRMAKVLPSCVER